MSRPTLYILDSFSLIYQVFHAIPLMTGPAGQPTNAVFGSFRDLMGLIKTRKPEYLAGAFDPSGPVFRSEVDARYKAQRKEMPDDLQPQVDVIQHLYRGFNIPVLSVPGFEADDVIATLATHANERGLDIYVCTADKDARQLLNEHTFIWNLRKNQVLDTQALDADWGVKPDQVVDLLALTGDSVDNVQGVPGIGVKTAAKLLQEFGTLDEILANVDKVKGKKAQEGLRSHADVARLARQLVTLRKDVPLDLDWDQLRYEGHDAKLLKALCIECGFHRFLDEIVDEKAPQETPWSLEGYQLIDTPEKLEIFVESLRQQSRFSVDTETTSLEPNSANLVGMSFCWEAGLAFYLPFMGPIGSRLLDRDQTLETLRPTLENKDIEKVGQNLKYDLRVLSRLGIEVAGSLTDTMVLSYLLESGERNHNLDELSRRLLDHTMIPITSLIGKGKSQTTMDRADVKLVSDYACEDADAAWRLEAILGANVLKEGLWDLYASLERPLICILAKMESAGIKVDVARLRILSEEFARRLGSIESEIYSLAGRPFNISSAAQLREVFFQELGLPVVKKTPGGEASTDAEVLEELAFKHLLPKLVLTYRQLEKLKGTYLDSLPELVLDDGRVHASFNQVVAATGRLSSSDPNLQNIPVRTEEGRQIRQAFVPGFPGWTLLSADYSQIELRILAHYSQDEELLRAFAENRDIHTVVAAQIFNVPESAVSANHRRVAKTVNFGVIYGLSPYGLASRLGITQKDAEVFIDAYFKQYEGVDRFITRTLEDAQTDGYVRTILGRRRSINGIKNTQGRTRNLAERTAVNTVIQGSAADLIKQAMINIDERISCGNFQGRMLLQIHDELVFECPQDELNDLSHSVRDAMTNALQLTVPIGVNLSAGPNWLDVGKLN